MCIMETNAVHRRCKGPSSFSFNNPADGWFVSGILVGWGRGSFPGGWERRRRPAFRAARAGRLAERPQSGGPRIYWARLS